MRTETCIRLFLFCFLGCSFCLTALAASTTTEKHEAAAVHLRCDALQNLLGIDDPHPQLSWQMQDSRRGAKQTAYQILVSSSPALLAKQTADIWDSGRKSSNHSLNIEYAGPQLESRRRYYWAVKIWDAEGVPSSLSGTTWWKMGLLNKADWKAQWINRSDPEQVADRSAGVKWIWLAGENANTHVPPGKRFFRYTLNLAAVPNQATFLVSGKDLWTPL